MPGCGSKEVGDVNMMLENSAIRVEISPKNGIASVTDLNTGVIWKMKDISGTSGILNVGNKQVVIGRETVGLVFDKVEAAVGDDFDSLTLSGSLPRGFFGNLIVEYRLWKSSSRLDLLIKMEGESAKEIENVTFPYGFSIDKDEKGYMAIPYKLGLMVPNTLDDFTRKFHLYMHQYQMRMFGGVKSNHDATAQSAYLAIPHSLYSLMEFSIVDNQEWMSTEVEKVQRATNSWEEPIVYSYYFIPEGDYVDIAKQYREWSMENGFFQTYEEKMQERPGLMKSIGAQFFGAVSILYDWRPAAEVLGKDELLKRFGISPPYYKMHNRFEDVIEPIKFLKESGLDKAAFHITGWNKAGYDGQFPDSFPANEDAGGNEKFKELVSTIEDLGYVAVPHDDLHCIYEDSPSYGAEVLARDLQGNAVFIGVWPGGTSWLPNNYYIMEYAKRNALEMQRICSPTGILLDVTTNLQLLDDYHKVYPMTYEDDMLWRQKILDLTSDHFDVVLSEDARDWGTPYYDYAFGYSNAAEAYWYTEPESKLVGAVIPLWDLVYHNCLIPLRTNPHGNNLTGEIRAADKEVKLFLRTLRAGVNPAIEVVGYQDMYTLFGWSLGQNADTVLEWNDLSKMQRIVTMSKVSIPFNEEVFNMYMTDHKFLSDNYMVEETWFDGKVRVIVNGAADVDYEIDDDTILSQLGFSIDGTTIEAYCARKIWGYEFTHGTLAAIISLDGEPVEKSSKLRVFKGFGDDVVVFPSDYNEAQLSDGTTISKNMRGLFVISVEAQQELELQMR